MKLRLFIALPLTSHILAKIGFLESRLEKKIGFKIPWLPLKNLHLTLLFLGYLSYEDFLKIAEIFENFSKVKNVIDKNYLNLKIKKIDYGPPTSKRMIWLYLDKDPKLSAWKKFFEEELEKRNIIYKREEREFLPHINLARLKDKRKYPEIKEELNWSFVLKEIALFQSNLKKEGAEYEKLKTIFLSPQ